MTWRAVRPAVRLSIWSAKGLLANGEAWTAAVEVGKDGKCWGLGVMLLVPSVPLPCRGGGGSPGGLNPASRGSAAALCIPCGLDVGAGWWRGEVRLRPPRLGILRFHFPVSAQLLAGLSGAPRLQGQPRAAAVGFLQGQTCWMGGKSCRGCVLTAGLQDSLRHMENCSCKGRFDALPGGAGSGLAEASLSALGPATELQGFALQPPRCALFPPGPALSKAFEAVELGKELF